MRLEVVVAVAVAVSTFSKNSLSSSYLQRHVSDPASEALWGPDYPCIFSTRRKILLYVCTSAWVCTCVCVRSHISVSMHRNPRQRKWRNPEHRKSWDKAGAEGGLWRRVNLSNKLVVGWLGRAPCRGVVCLWEDLRQGRLGAPPSLGNWNWNDDRRDAIRQRCAGR